MEQLNPELPWKPNHVIVGRKVTLSSLSNHDLLIEELREHGFRSSNMRSQLMIAAVITTKAIKNMLVS